jgi:hypothetical protein
MSAPPTPPESPKRASCVAKLAACVAGHSYVALAIIVVLLVIIVGTYIYYHGFWVLGPYANAPSAGIKKGKGLGKGFGKSAAEPKSFDPEIERLIAMINNDK